MTSWPQISHPPDLSLGFLSEESLQAFTSRVLATLFQLQGCSLRLSIRFCDDSEIGEVHERFFGDPSTTDVISFPLADPSKHSFQNNSSAIPEEEIEEAQGEILVCIPFAERQAALHGNPVSDEVALYLIHGCLHILGFDDQDEEALEEMVRQENACLEKLGFSIRGR